LCFLGAFLRIWLGDTDAALHYLSHAMRLSPLDPELYRMQAGMALANLFAGRFELSIAWAEKALRSLPGLLLAVAVLAASQALSGRTADAQKTLEQLNRLEPTLRVSNLREWLPIQRPENLETLTEGLRKAGLRA